MGKTVHHNSSEHNSRSFSDEMEALRAENIELKQHITELTQRFSELEIIADTDTLTPLPNRRCFERELDRVIRHVARYGTGAAVLFVDIDGLKKINDNHGHSAGDAALVHTATLLRDAMRSTDLVARIGGDEFALIVDPIHEAALLKKIAVLTKILRSHPFVFGNVSSIVEVSMGYTMICGDDRVQTVLQRADEAMYGEKRAHR